MESIFFILGCVSAATAVGLGGARAHVLERFLPRGWVIRAVRLLMDRRR